MDNLKHYLKSSLMKLLEKIEPISKEQLQRNLRWLHNHGVEISPMIAEEIVKTKYSELREEYKEIYNSVCQVIVENFEEWINL